MNNETPSFIIAEAGGDTEFYAAYGLALSLWSWVEHALCGVYLCAVPTSHIETLGRSFFAVTSFRDKVAMVHVVVSETLAVP